MLDRTPSLFALALTVAMASCSKLPPELAAPDVAAPSPDIAAPAPDVAEPDVSAPDDPASPADTREGGWVRLAPKGEGFAIAFPADPLRELKPTRGPQGHTAELIQYTWSRDDLALIVSASPLVAQLVEHGDKDLALDRTLASQVDLPGRTVRYKKVTDEGDVRGREAEVDLTIADLPARLRMRLYMKGTLIFQVLALWPVVAGQAEVPPAVDRFFASFALSDDVAAIAPAIDLWQVFPVPELGLSVELPKQPEVTTAATDTFLGKTDVTTMVAITSFPISMYSVEVATVPAAHVDKDDAALLKLWKDARVAAYEGTAAPEVLGEEATELFGAKGRLLILRDKLPNGQTRDGHLRAIVERTDGKATRIIIASAWAIDPKELPAITRRFYAGLKKTQ